LIFFYQCKQLVAYIYTDIYCKLSKCIGQIPCPYEHHLVLYIILMVVPASRTCSVRHHNDVTETGATCLSRLCLRDVQIAASFQPFNRQAVRVINDVVRVHCAS